MHSWRQASKEGASLIPRSRKVLTFIGKRIENLKFIAIFKENIFYFWEVIASLSVLSTIWSHSAADGLIVVGILILNLSEVHSVANS